MIKFLQLLTIDRPILSFLFANLLATSLTLYLIYVVMLLFSFITFTVCSSSVFLLTFWGVPFIADDFSFYKMLFIFPYFILPIVFNSFLKYKKGGFFYNIIYALRYNIISRLFVIPMAIIEWCFVDKLLNFDNFIDCVVNSLSMSYLVLFFIWSIQDLYCKYHNYLKKYFVYLKEILVQKYLMLKNKVLVFIRKYPRLTFILLNLFCSGYIYISFICAFAILPFYWFYSSSTTVGNVVSMIIFVIAFLLFILRYTLIINVYDFYLKEKIPCVSDFILKIKNSTCKKILLFANMCIFDYICYIVFKQNDAYIEFYQIFLFFLFYGLSVSYLLLYYYWYLENKHKDVLAEVEVKEYTGVV